MLTHLATARGTHAFELVAATGGEYDLDWGDKQAVLQGGCSMVLTIAPMRLSS